MGFFFNLSALIVVLVWHEKHYKFWLYFSILPPPLRGKELILVFWREVSFAKKCYKTVLQATSGGFIEEGENEHNSHGNGVMLLSESVTLAIVGRSESSL